MSFDWEQIVKTVAPVLGTALGGPLGGAAVRILADNLLGNPHADEQEIAQALQNPTPDQLLKIKASEQAFMLELKKLDLENYKAETADLANARHENNQNNKLTDELIKIYLVICLSTIVYICLYAIIKQNVEGVEANLVSGVLGSAFTAIIAMVYFYWGDSKNSAMKDNFIMNNKK